MKAPRLTRCAIGMAKASRRRRFEKPCLRRCEDFFDPPAIKRDGDVMKVLDVLARDVGIRGSFSDCAATVTYYANCMGVR